MSLSLLIALGVETTVDTCPPQHTYPYWEPDAVHSEPSLIWRETPCSLNETSIWIMRRHVQGGLLNDQVPQNIHLDIAQ